MIVTLKFRNYVPEITLIRRDFLGALTREKLDRHPSIQSARELVCGDPVQLHTLDLELGLLGSDVVEVAVELKLYDRQRYWEVGSNEPTAQWGVFHGPRRLSGSRLYIRPPHPLPEQMLSLEDQSIMWKDPSFSLRREPDDFAASGALMAPRWTIAGHLVLGLSSSGSGE